METSAAGEMAEMVRAFDWDATPLGPMETWPGPLRHIVDFMLASPGLASVAAGPQRILIYNDAAAAQYGANHPRALGRPLAETFDEYPRVAGFYDRAFAGESVHIPAQPLDPSGEDRDEVYEAFLTPIRGAADEVVAVHMSGIARGSQARAEAALRESEARHRLLIGSVAQAVWETDAAGVVVADSPSWRAYTGQTRAEWLGYGWLDAIHPDDRAYAERQWREAVAARGLVDAEFRLRAPDGGWRWTNVRAAPVPDACGNIAKWAGMNIDIEARKQADIALRASEERFRALLTAGVYTIYRMSPDWRLMYRLDSQTLAATTAPIEDWVEKYIPGDDLANMQAAIAHAISTKSLFELEHRVVQADGSIGWVLSRAMPLLDANGEITEWFGAGSDVTARRLADDRLRESEERFRALFETMDEAYAVVEVLKDYAGRWCDFRFLAANPAFMVHTGMPYPVGRTATELPGSPNPRWTEMYGEALDTGRTLRVEESEATLGLTFDLNIFVLDPERNRVAVLFTNITARKHTETALREREAELALTQRIGQVAGLDVELSDPPVGHRSPEYRQLHGLPPDQAIETHAQWLARLHPEDRKREDREFWDAVERGHVFQSEYRIIRPSDGAERWISARGLIEHDDAGRPVRVRGAYIDVTERKRASAALRESEERQRLMVELVPALLWSVGPDGREVALNERWLAYTGQSVVETQDYGWLDAIHPDDLPAARAAFERAFASGGPIEREQRVRKAGDGYRWHLVRHVPLRDEQGAIVRWFGAAVDIHESKLAAEALDDSERWLQTLMQGVPQLVWRAVDDGRWTWASPQWTDFTGQAERDSHGLGWLDPVHPDDRELAMQAWAGAASRGEFHADYRLCHTAEHRYRWFQTRATPVRDDQGQITEWLGTSTDVDDLRGLQDRQQVLLAELQHRVRNILAIIRSIMRRSLDGEQSLHDYAQHLEGRIDALARTQVLLTRQANARVDLEDLLRDELVAQAADERRVVLRGPDVALSPQAAEVLGLAAHELATNAVKYGAIGQPGGQLTVEWAVEDRRGEPWLSLQWSERGVSVAVRTPPRSGFGTELITRRVPYELKGQGDLAIAVGGVTCTISFPLRDGSSVLETGAAISLKGEPM